MRARETMADGGGSPDYLTTKELATLLRVKERRVYDLAAAGEVPCSRVTGKLLFPRRAVDAWLAASLDGPGPVQPRPMVMLGSHDPLLEWALRQSGAAIPSFFDGSEDGLARFAEREGAATALHLFDPESDSWNIPAVAAMGRGDGAVLISFCRRRRGLMLGRGEKRRPRNLGEMADWPFARRQPGSGAETLLRHLAAKADLDEHALPAALVVRSEADAALAIAEGRAQAALGLEALAKRHGLIFVPLVEEPLDLLIDRQAFFEPAMQRFLAFCRGFSFVKEAGRLPGYSANALGRVRWNGA